MTPKSFSDSQILELILSLLGVEPALDLMGQIKFDYRVEDVVQKWVRLYDDLGNNVEFRLIKKNQSSQQETIESYRFFIGCVAPNGANSSSISLLKSASDDGGMPLNVELLRNMLSVTKRLIEFGYWDGLKTI